MIKFFGQSTSLGREFSYHAAAAAAFAAFSKNRRQLGLAQDNGGALRADLAFGVIPLRRFHDSNQDAGRRRSVSRSLPWGDFGGPANGMKTGAVPAEQRVANLLMELQLDGASLLEDMAELRLGV